MISTHAMHGRGGVLELVASRLGEAGTGTGGLLLLTGEAGIGKTRLLRELVDLAADRGARTWGAGAFPRDVELPAGLLLDLGHTMSRSDTPDVARRGRELLDELVQVADPTTSGDAHRRRRLLVLDVAGRIASLADDGPAVLALEDLHWCDELSLEVVAHLARRLPGLPLLVVATIRTDELHAGVPVRSWRARLLGQRMAEDVPLTRLDLEQTERMVAELLPDHHASRRLLELLHERSGGVPLHVEELVEAAARGRLSTDPTYVPETLAETVRHRFVTLSTAAQDLAVAAAVIRRSFDLDLLTSVAGCDVDHAARCLDELVDRYFVREEAPGWFGFRHALIRDAVELGAPLARRRALHARVAQVARRRTELGGDAYRSAHHEVAGQLDEASRAAEAAAERASALSAHQEALELLHRALRCLHDDGGSDGGSGSGGDGGDGEAGDGSARRVALHVRRAAEASATDHNELAARDYERARTLLLEHGDRRGAAALLPGLVAARHLLGDDLASRLALLDQGLQDVAGSPQDAAPDAAPDRERQRVRADLLAAKAAAYLVDDRLDEAVVAGEQALAAADHGPDSEPDERTRLNTAATLGSVLAFVGRTQEGFDQLEAAVVRARELGWEAEAARGYRLIGSSASCLVEYDRAEHWLGEGVEYAERTEQWNHRHYMAAHQAHVHWARGRWDEAELAVEQVLADGGGGITTRITAQHVSGFLLLGLGRLPEAVCLLQEVRSAGEEMHELQRFAPAVWGLAECALLRRDHAAAVALSAAGHDACHDVADAASLFPFLVTGVRARLAGPDAAAAHEWVDRVGGDLLARGIPGTLPAVDHAAGLLHLAAGRTGKARDRLAAAHEGWSARGRWWERQWCALDLARCALAANRRTEASELVGAVASAASAVGATPLLEAGEQIGSRLDAHDTAPPWAPLTMRELEVARLVARGLTNRQIAGRLHVTVRTAGSHLEHISAKLGTSSRSEVASWVTALGPWAEPADQGQVADRR